MTTPEWVYIAESVFIEDNPWDGRTRYGIHTSLEGALKALESFGDEDDPLKATEVDDYADYHDPDKHGRTWMVHRASEMPREEGHLWIFKERLLA